MTVADGTFIMATMPYEVDLAYSYGPYIDEWASSILISMGGEKP